VFKCLCKTRANILWDCDKGGGGGKCEKVRSKTVTKGEYSKNLSHCRITECL